jgi:signal transduction histidine kinase/HAMP domain-containing protein
VTIRARIFTVVGVVLAAALVQTGLVVRLERDRSDAATRLAAALERVQYQTQLGRLLVQLEGAQRAYVFSGDLGFKREYARLFADYQRTVTVLPQSLDEELRARLRDIDTAVRDWHLNASETLIARRAFGPVPLEDAAGLNDARFGIVRARLAQFEALAETRFVDARDRASHISFVATIVSMAVPGVAVVMLLILVAFLARIVLDPLAAVARSAKQISSGTFDVKLPRPRHDELGDLIRAFREMSLAVERRETDLVDALERERETSQQLEAQRTSAEREHARLLATVATVPAALVILEAPSGRIVLQNHAADALIGREPDDDEARRAHWERFRATYRDGAPCPVDEWGPAQALRGDTVVAQELILERADGTSMPILVSAAPLRDDQGAITGAVGAFQDITNLYEVDRLKTEFVSIVSHELRTPLTSIKGALQLLNAEAESLDPDHRTLVNVALSNTGRLIRIINDILDISKIEAGKLSLNTRPCEPWDLVRVSIEAVASIASGASVSIVPIMAPGVPRVMVDADRTVQAIVNLLSNALKYAPPHTDVTIAVGRMVRQLRIAVSDRGPGIAPDKLSLLFQKFQQVDGVDTRRYRGTGLGLAITKALVEMQGGQVFVESREGDGSTFSITLPIVDEP